MDLYAQNILDRYKTPHYKDLVIKVDAKRVEANHSCGDKVELRLTIKAGRVTGYAFSGEGCAISMAAADMLGDLIHGMTKAEIMAITKETVYEMLGVEISLRRSKCALLSLLALHNALGDDKKNWTFYHL